MVRHYSEHNAFGGQFLSQSANDSVTLTLTNLPAHLSASVSFDLYLIESTEENEQYVWDLNVEGGPVLLDTTFNYNPENTQASPDNYPGQTDDSEIDTPVNLSGGDMVYSFPNSDRSFTINHTDSTLVLHFSESGLATQNRGLDNVLVILEQPEMLTVVDIDPDTLNLNSNGNWITCYLTLPEGSNVAEIDPKTVMLEDSIVADWMVFNEEEQIAMIKFSRSAIQDFLIEQGLLGDVELTVTGELLEGTAIKESDTIRIIDKGGKKN